MKFSLNILFFVVVLCGFAACKQDIVVPNAVTNGPYLNVVNATADTLDYFINGTRQNNLSDIYPGGSTYYLQVLFGKGTYSFKKAGSQVTLFSEQFNLDTAVDYSLFVCGESTAKTFMVTDNYASVYSIPDSLDLSAVRFVNASPNAGSVDVVVTTGSKTAFSLHGQTFETVSPYQILKDTISDVKIYTAGTTTLLKDTTVSLIGGQIYTLFTKGTPNSRGNAGFGAVLTIANATAQVE